MVDGNYSAIWEIVWNRADTVVWFDLPMPRLARRSAHAATDLTREELWNGNGSRSRICGPSTPEKSIIAWTATRHKVYRQRYVDAPEPAMGRLRFVPLGLAGEADGFLAACGPPDEGG